jgi:chromosome segregation protein
MSAALAEERRHSDALVALERAQLAREALEERARADGIELSTLNPVEEDGDDRTLPERTAQLQGRLRRMGPVNALAPAEYATLLERHTFLNDQLADVRTASAMLREAIQELEDMMDTQFDRTFSAVAREFSAAFTQLFGGGTARLALVGSEENGDGRPTRRGIEIVAQPPGKRQLHLQLLSGGERALTAGALLFAILKHQPRPFCMLDEVDAALDESNVVRFREALKELARDTQFIVITHNRGTVEAADTLYGITMGEDSGSRVLSLRFVPGEDELVERGDGE